MTTVTASATIDDGTVIRLTPPDVAASLIDGADVHVPWVIYLDHVLTLHCHGDSLARLRDAIDAALAEQAQP